MFLPTVLRARKRDDAFPPATYKGFNVIRRLRFGMNLTAEREKWDEIYRKQERVDLGSLDAGFYDEFAEFVLALGEGGAQLSNSLEVGCGSGLHSVALARKGLAVGLSDFSAEALRVARTAFDEIGLPAIFYQDDMLSSRIEEKYDLVFNSGVLEHYAPQQQVQFLKAMASRSKRYVSVLVPNRNSYWYWVWRLKASASEQWEWGKELAAHSYKSQIEAAGMSLVRVDYFAADWTEDQIRGVGLDAETENIVLTAHRSGVVDPVNSSYLVCFTAVVGRTDHIHTVGTNETTRLDAAVAAAADATAMALMEHRELAKAQKALAQTREELDVANASLGNLAHQVRQLESDNREWEDLKVRFNELSKLTPRLQNELIEAKNALSNSEVRRNYFEYMSNAYRNSSSWSMTAPVRALSSSIAEASGIFARNYKRARYALANPGKATALLRTKFDRKSKSLPSSSAAIELVERSSSVDNLDRAPLRQKETVIILAGVPFDDVGGGQRSSQLARVMTRSGFRVIYVYAFKKYDFELGRQVDSPVEILGMEHIFVDNVTPEKLFANDGAQQKVVFEIPADRYLPFLIEANTKGLETTFELIDNWGTSLGGDWFTQESYRRFVSESKFVIGTARGLVDQLVDMGRDDARYLPNAVNDSIFDHYVLHSRPIEYDEHRPVLLYYGSLYGEWFGWEYIAAAANMCPQKDVVLIGDRPANAPSMPNNVRFLGGRLIDKLPAYLQHCQAALLPFRPGKISDAVSPIKIFEYIAMCRPVVATPLPEIIDYPNVIFGVDETAFAQACLRVGEVDRAKAEIFTAGNTWSSRATEIVQPRENKCISLIILIHNNEQIIGRCLQSIIANSRRYVKEIIVVDNQSSDNGAAVAKSFAGVTVLTNEMNGCASGRNIGIDAASGDIIGFFDSDQWVTSDLCFLEAIGLLRDRSIGAVGWAAGWLGTQSPTLGGPIIDYLPARGTAAPEYLSHGARADIHYLGSGGLFLRRDLASEIGGFDPDYDPTCFEDTDFSFKIRNAGYTLLYRDLTGIRHQPHQTTGANSSSDAYNDLFFRNGKLLRKKWQALVDHLPTPSTT